VAGTDNDALRAGVGLPGPRKAVKPKSKRSTKLHPSRCGWRIRAPEGGGRPGSMGIAEDSFLLDDNLGIFVIRWCSAPLA
jgi:hypothetical protein